MNEPRLLRGHKSPLIHCDVASFHEEESPMGKLTEYVLVPKTVTEAQADMLGVPVQVYERIVSVASRYTGQNSIPRSPVDNTYVSLLPIDTGIPSSSRIDSVATEDRIEKLQPPFYIRWTSGLNYEKAYLCVEDGEPDMRDFACVSYGMAILFKAGLEALKQIDGKKKE